MTPLAELECRYDGAIPQAEWDAAAASARIQEPDMKRTARVRRAAPARDVKDLPRRMADRMVEAAKLRGRCHRQDLLQAGFSPKQIDLHADAARALAGQGFTLEVPA